MSKKKPRKRPTKLRLGECSPFGGRASAYKPHRDATAFVFVPWLSFTADRNPHIDRMRRLAAWLVEAADWLEQEAERG